MRLITQRSEIKGPIKDEINRIITIGDGKVKVGCQIEKKCHASSSLISSLFSTNLEILNNRKHIISRTKNRIIAHFFSTEILAKIFTLRNETNSAWETEMSKQYDCRKVEFKATTDLGGIEMVKTADEGDQDM